jgi:hypothetical protein
MGYRNFYRLRRPPVLPPADAEARLHKMMYHGRRAAADDLRRLAAGEFAAVADLVHAEADKLEVEAAEADARLDTARLMRRHERRTAEPSAN